MKVLSLIGDIHGSRTVTDRESLQKRLAAALKTVNRQNDSLLSPYTITLGDEFQAVYRDAGRLFRDIWSIIPEVYPHKIRFAIGVGPLTTEINPRQAIGMDGPAFHYARSGIQDMKESPYLFRITGENMDHQNLINQSLNLISYWIDNWEKNRFLILLGLYLGKSSKQMATALGISTVAVYKNINAGALEVVKSLTQEIGVLIDRELGR